VSTPKNGFGEWVMSLFGLSSGPRRRRRRALPLPLILAGLEPGTLI
jgi:hypothetical protein